VLSKIVAWFRGKNDGKSGGAAAETNTRLFDDKIKQMLISLGKNPEEIAAALFKEEIFGKRRDVFHCPISNRIIRLIQAYMPEYIPDGDIYVCVSSENFTANLIPSRSDQAVLLARGQLPRAVSHLIIRFDNNEFPELEG
jgi:hypothetical protein